MIWVNGQGRPAATKGFRGTKPGTLVDLRNREQAQRDGRYGEHDIRVQRRDEGRAGSWSSLDADEWD